MFCGQIGSPLHLSESWGLKTIEKDSDWKTIQGHQYSFSNTIQLRHWWLCAFGRLDTKQSVHHQETQYIARSIRKVVDGQRYIEESLRLQVVGKQSSLQVLKVHDKSLVGSFHQFDLSLSFKASPNNQMTIVNLYLQSMADAFYWDTGFRGCVSNTPWKIWERWIWVRNAIKKGNSTRNQSSQLQSCHTPPQAETTALSRRCQCSCFELPWVHGQ